MILAAEIGPPALIILAGPNGAGKSTLYRNELQDRYRSLEFINADELAMRYFGHAMQTGSGQSSCTFDQITLKRL